MLYGNTPHLYPSAWPPERFLELPPLGGLISGGCFEEMCRLSFSSQFFFLPIKTLSTGSRCSRWVLLSPHVPRCDGVWRIFLIQLLLIKVLPGLKVTHFLWVFRGWTSIRALVDNFLSVFLPSFSKPKGDGFLFGPSFRRASDEIQIIQAWTQQGHWTCIREEGFYIFAAPTNFLFLSVAQFFLNLF